ncbi:MAG TPA: glycosyltransferase family 2 protein [Candidatus Limnocylindria bacterium]|nr:glycosyltransferase family 2 protein [Candidatus Limnocylindria bacterium]
MRVAALIPAYQAAAHLGEVLLRLRALDTVPDTLVVDDGSRDATAEVARQMGVRVLSFAANRGKGHALLAGFEALSEYDAIVTLDADGQHPPECLPAFVRAAEGGADLVLGRRARTPDMPWTRRFANGFSSGWASRLAGQQVSDSQCGFRLYRRTLIEATPVTPGRYEFESEVVVRAARLGFRLAEVEIPTVYGEEKSQLSSVRDVPRIVGVLARLTLEGLRPPPAMRAARARRRVEATA